MCEHTWWMILRDEGNIERCGLCSKERPVTPGKSYSVNIVEAGEEDDQD
jgi:hypothetical protein